MGGYKGHCVGFWGFFCTFYIVNNEQVLILCSEESNIFL